MPAEGSRQQYTAKHPPWLEGVFFMQILGRRALIFANGDLMDRQALRAMIRPDDFLVAADGGLRHLRALGLQPEVLIGDLDSVEPEEVDALRAQGVRIEQYPVHKDETDLELAVEMVLQAGCKTLLIVGALGGRLDMTLANLFLLTLPALKKVDARLEDGIDQVFLIRAGLTGRVIEGLPGDRVSLLPLGGPVRGVHTTGLFYPLHAETLYPERTRGISNRMLEPQAHVSLESGTLICIHSRQQDAGEQSIGGNKV
jgi:thiamine pyrophosphokinase